MTAPLLSVEGVGYSVGARALLADIGFTVNTGEVLALVGPNGSGKTTLGRAVAGLLDDYHGVIRHHGADQTRLDQRARARAACFVPQAPTSTPSFTVREFIRLARYAHKDAFQPGDADDREAADAAMAFVGLERFADRTLPTLSGGERQLAWIAAAVAQAAPLLWLDEPTAFLDPQRQTDILNQIQRLNRERGMTIVMTTHDLNAALLGVPRVLALKNGRLAYDGPVGDFAQTDRLREIYDVTFSLVDHPGAPGRRMVLPPLPWR